MASLKAKQKLSIGQGKMGVIIHLLLTLRDLATTIIDVDEIVVTSINDASHLPNSRHYKNEAIDIRSKNFPSKEAKEEFRARYEHWLGRDKFRVILENEGKENEHFHAQVKKGIKFDA